MSKVGEILARTFDGITNFESLWESEEAIKFYNFLNKNENKIKGPNCKTILTVDKTGYNSTVSVNRNCLTSDPEVIIDKFKAAQSAANNQNKNKGNS